MANINVSVGELICEDPVFTSVTYDGTRYEFNLNWTSNGNYLSTIDNTTTMYLIIELYHASDLNNPYSTFSPNTPPSIPFDGVNYLINILDYVANFSSKDQIVFKLVLAGEATCVNTASYTIPPDSI